MKYLNETHDPSLTSWVESANQADTDFPIQNLPYAVFRRAGTSEPFRGGVAIGDQVLDLAEAHAKSPFAGLAGEALAVCAQSTLNNFMSMGSPAWSALRLSLSKALRSGSTAEASLGQCLVPMATVEHALPCTIGDYTDFYSSIHHATSVGSLFRPDNPLLPNYKWVPIAYHGRASSLASSPQAFHRPVGQTRTPDASAPTVGSCKKLDYELEIGVFLGPGNELGQPVAIEEAEQHIFGLCLLNDLSARDIQAWEYQPLGPFLSKSFASTLSPWVVTLEALAPFRQPFHRPESDPQPLPYLSSDNNWAYGAFDIELAAMLETEQMRKQQLSSAQLSRTSFRHSYWTLAQMVTHHTVNGCNLRPGDLLGTGTQSGPGAEEAGSLLELTAGGKQALALPSGESRTFLENGDTVILRAWCEKQGAARIGFGHARSQVLPAK